MIAGNFSIYRVFIHVVPVIVISCAQLSALSFRAAAYDYDVMGVRHVAVIIVTRVRIDFTDRK